MTAHTLGPWHVDNDLARGDRVISDREAGIVAVVQGAEEPERWDVPNEERDANARLIAEAPAMLTAIGDLLTWMEQTKDHDNMARLHSASLDNFRALLARIDGGTTR